jgi:hypothetical protein
MGVFNEYITKKCQIHIGKAVEPKIKPGNGNETIPDENKKRSRVDNIIKLSYGEEIIMENYAEINCKFIKAANYAIILRNMFE